MAWLISVLGAALALAGAISLGNGISYIRLDWGQAETVAGTVALSAGIVTLGLGAILFAVRDVAARPARAETSGVGMEALSWSEDDAPVQPPLSRLRAKLATVGAPRAERDEPAEVPPAAVPAPARDLDSSVPEVRYAAEAPPLRPSLAAEPASAPRAPAAVAPPVLDAPTVVGRYEANGASYVLFSDGTIEVETENGTHRFASMADLKDHIERQEAV